VSEKAENQGLDLSNHPQKLKELVEGIIDAIVESLPSLPYGLRFIAACLKDLLLRKYKDLEVAFLFFPPFFLLGFSPKHQGSL